MPKIRSFFKLLFLLLVSVFPACSSIEYPADQSPRMQAIGETPFFLHGPAQGSGADRTLPSGYVLNVLKKDFGYSLVQLADGQKGYVANESLEVAPPLPSPKERREEKYSTGTGDDSLPPWEKPSFRY